MDIKSLVQQKHGETLRNKRKTPLIQLHFLSKRFRSLHLTKLIFTTKI